MKQIAIIATTHVDSHFQRMTREALEKVAERINYGAKLALGIEHDLTLPPLGKMIRAWVELREDGEYHLVGEKEYFEQSTTITLANGLRVFKEESEADHSPFVNRFEETSQGYELAYDVVNFETREVEKLFTATISAELSDEVTLKQFGRKSTILDPEIIVKIAEAVTTCLVAKKVLDRAGDKVIDLALEEVTKFYSVVRSAVISAAKYLHPKGRPVTYIFVLAGEPAIEFIARSADPHFVLSAVLLEKLKVAVDQAQELHLTFKATKIQYLLDDKGNWEFNYLLTSTGAVIGTEDSYNRRARRLQLFIDEAKKKNAAINDRTSQSRRK